MKPSKKKSKNRKTKSPQTKASPSIDPNLQQPLPIPDETLDSTSQSRSRDLAWLSDAFSSLSVAQIESTYDQAGCDPFKAAGILGTHLEEEKKEHDRRNVGSTLREGSSQRKAKRGRPRNVAISTGIVSSVIGKGYVGSRSESNENGRIQGEVRYTAEEAEEFLCSMLGDESDLGMAVVRDILGVCRGEVEKALELLLELSDSSYRPQMRERSIPAAKNSLNYSHIFRGMGCKNPPEGNITSLEVGDRPSSLTYHPSESEKDLFFERHKRDTQPMEQKQSNPELEQKVLESLFNLHEVKHAHTYAPGHMDWRKIVKKLQNGQDFELHSKAISATGQNLRNGEGDGYHEFRTVAQQNWDMMKMFFQRAAAEYSRGNRSHAALLAEKGNYYRGLARLEDEKASLDIFRARNRAINNTVTIDLHGLHVKQAIDMLKRHLLSFACVPSVGYLKVITGCGENGVGKGKMKRSVKSLAARENIEWSEENSGTILLKIEGRKEYTFTESDIDEE
ncbi:SMR domain-containing protein [Rhynchospora pubera]|uniref:SMR domain-containing protein n=1 Tax=Rhynchospora pubera TaxID=906938 RepID=A0AAV8CD96_9POAL|nr:SMR domain-containing protein [Rhynchospora pubera]